MSEMQYDRIREKEMHSKVAVWAIETFDRHFELLWPLINTVDSNFIRATIIAFGQDFSSVKNGCRQCLFRSSLFYNFVTAEACSGYDPDLWQRNYEQFGGVSQRIMRVHTHPKQKTHRMSVRRHVENSVNSVFKCKLDEEQSFCLRKDGFGIRIYLDDHRSTRDISFWHHVFSINEPGVFVMSSALGWIGLPTVTEWEIARDQQGLDLMVSQVIELSQIFFNECPWGLDKLSFPK